MKDLTRLLNAVRAVCFQIPPERFGIIIEPFEYMSPKLSWKVSVVLYKDTDQREIVAVIGKAESRYNFSHPEADVSAEIAVQYLRESFERNLAAIYPAIKETTGEAHGK